MPPERAYDQNIQDPHMMVQCASSPDTLWVQHHNGIFRSDDGAAHWHEITNMQPSVFGFAEEMRVLHGPKHGANPMKCLLKSH